MYKIRCNKHKTNYTRDMARPFGTMLKEHYDITIVYTADSRHHWSIRAFFHDFHYSKSRDKTSITSKVFWNGFASLDEFLEFWDWNSYNITRSETNLSSLMQCMFWTKTAVVHGFGEISCLMPLVSAFSFCNRNFVVFYEYGCYYNSNRFWTERWVSEYLIWKMSNCTWNH